MAITKTMISNSPNKVRFKITSTVAAESIAIVIKDVAVPTALTATFNAANRTITRSAGSWVADFTVSSRVPPLGSNVFITFTGGTVNNVNRTYAAKLTSTLVLTVDPNYTVIEENAIAVSNVQWSGYWSDVAQIGQAISTTPEVNITKVKYSTTAVGDIRVERNSVVILKLFGSDSIEENAGLAEQNSFPVVVTFTTTAGGTVFIELAKVAGFSYQPSWTQVGT
jgi:hypothetical protein